MLGLSLDDVLAGFPGDLFLLLVGLTYLFALATANGTVDLLVHWAMPFARRYGINLLLMGMMVVHGALGGAFSPITVYGAFVNSTMATVGLPSDRSRCS